MKRHLDPFESRLLDTEAIDCEVAAYYGIGDEASQPEIPGEVYEAALLNPHTLQRELYRGKAGDPSDTIDLSFT